MFRRIEATLPADQIYSADLNALGYFINETGHVRKIAHPEEDFQFHLTNEARHNEVHREAMQECQRQEVLARLAKLGIAPLYLTQFETHVIKPSKPHVPILCPPIDVLRFRKHVILVINDSQQDLGILAYRQLQRELGLNGGSVVNFAKEIVKRSKPDAETADFFRDNAGVPDVDNDAPGLIVANTGQRYYSHKHNRPMTLRSWSAMPRKSMCHEQPQIDEVENTVPGHRDSKEHIKTIFKEIINNDQIVPREAAIYVIGIENGGQHLLELLDEEWSDYGRRIMAMALIQTGCSSEQLSNVQLKTFLRKRAREWKIASIDEANVCVEDPRANENGTAIENSATIPREVEHRLHWLERVFRPQPIREALASRSHICSPPPKEQTARQPEDTGHLCPAFSGGPTGIAECIFTDPIVYGSILDFFEEVYQHDRDAGGYANPKFEVHVPLSEAELERKAMLPPDMSLEQQIIEDKKAAIEHMKQSLEVTPNTDMFKKGRANLERRIQQAEKDLDDMIREEAANDLKQVQIEEPKSDWQPIGQGPKAPFAGTTVELDLLKGAGFIETA